VRPYRARWNRQASPTHNRAGWPPSAATSSKAPCAAPDATRTGATTCICTPGYAATEQPTATSAADPRYWIVSICSRLPCAASRRVVLQGNSKVVRCAGCGARPTVARLDSSAEPAVAPAVAAGVVVGGFEPWYRLRRLGSPSFGCLLGYPGSRPRPGLIGRSRLRGRARQLRPSARPSRLPVQLVRRLPHGETSCPR
jgi:hypothetical protein